MGGLAEKGFGAEPLAEMRAIISPDLSDLFAVLAQVASALAADPPPSQRPQRSRLSIHSRSTSRQPLFLDVVPQHDVTIGVRELAREKLTQLLCTQTRFAG